MLPRWLVPAATTLVAWLVAFLVVMTLLTLFGDALGSLPLALRALVISGVLVALMVNLVMPVVSVAVARFAAVTRRIPRGREHLQLAALPDWPAKTIAVLSTLDQGPHAIPVSAPLRAESRRILISLHRSRASLARLRTRPEVALTILAPSDVALTARGRATVVQDPMAHAPDYVAVAIEVAHIDDHRQPQFVVESGVDRRWVDEDEQHALHERVEALTALAAEA